MPGHEREYRWYRTGCDRLGQIPLSEPEFEARWQEFENHAELLKRADQEHSLSSIETGVRTQMQNRIKDDPFVKAVLVGMAEEESAH
jgi:hypothetical protein